MRRGAIWILVFVMLFSTACAESLQKAPDYVMEGYDGDLQVERESHTFYPKKTIGRV